MTYNPSIKMYYYQAGTSPSEANRVVPVPQINITPEYYYANDIIIGYTYNIQLAGYATSLDLRQNQTEVLGIEDTFESIQTLKNIFNRNNGTLQVTDPEGTILKAFGGTIRGIQFNESANSWINYSEYTIDIEFNEIQLSDCSGLKDLITCGDIAAGVTDSPLLIDMKQYKVKSFSDGWSFSVDDNAYNTYSPFLNEYINIGYNIAANGRHYFVNDKLIPAWEQAKNFCQYRLKQQVDRLVGNALQRTGTDDGCETLGNLASIFGNGPPGLIDGLSGAGYGIYNEKITCNTSEAEGSFEANYSAILKRTLAANQYSHPHSIHTFSVTKNISDDGKQKNTELSIQGNIQGLVPGGLIKSAGVISFPVNGSIFVSDTPTSNKYDNALTAYNIIGNNKNLNNNFLTLVGVTNSAVGVSGECVDESGAPPTNTLNIVHNYIEGTINYSSSFDTANACKGSGSSYQTINVDVEESTPVIAEFVVPGRSGGPIIQRLNVDKPKRVTINIQGSKPPDECCATTEELVDINCTIPATFSGVPVINIPNSILTQNQYTKSTDGSFSIIKSYVYCN